MCFFVFKQKTAYEIRISDWSSDVCSSDLVNHNEKCRGAGGVHVADQPAPLHVTHDVFDRAERLGSAGLVEHRQPDAGDHLVDQHQHRQRTEVVPDIEVFRGVILRHVLLVGRHQARRALVEPVDNALNRTSDRASHYATPSGLTPITRCLSSAKRYGGTSRLLGAGTPCYTRPAMLYLEL